MNTQRRPHFDERRCNYAQNKEFPRRERRRDVTTHSHENHNLQHNNFPESQSLLTLTGQQDDYTKGQRENDAETQEMKDSNFSGIQNTCTVRAEQNVSHISSGDFRRTMRGRIANWIPAVGLRTQKRGPTGPQACRAWFVASDFLRHSKSYASVYLGLQTPCIHQLSEFQNLRSYCNFFEFATFAVEWCLQLVKSNSKQVWGSMQMARPSPVQRGRNAALLCHHQYEYIPVCGTEIARLTAETAKHRQSRHWNCRKSWTILNQGNKHCDFAHLTSSNLVMVQFSARLLDRRETSEYE